MWEQVQAEDVDRVLQRSFGSALERIGFQPSSRRRWSSTRGLLRPQYAGAKNIGPALAKVNFLAK